jgi:RNA polymerase sigma-70 factor (ECF subfamily)
MIGQMAVIEESELAFQAPVLLGPDDSRASAPACSRLLSAPSEQRLRKLVDEHLDSVWHALRALGVPSSSADDAAQQVFLVAAQKLEQIAIGSEKAFLLATSRGIAANIRRSLARNREQSTEVLAETMDEAPDPELSAASNQARRLLEQVLDSMEEDLRTVFVLFELEGKTSASIAEMLCIPAGTVASRLRRAREHFQRAASELQAELGGM